MRQVDRRTLRTASAVLTETRWIDGLPVFIVDDVFNSPDQVRDFSKTLDYGLSAGRRQYRTYPGERAQVSIFPESLLDVVLATISEVSDLSKDRIVKYPLTFTRVRPDAVPALHYRQRVPHLDVESQFSGVVFLCEGAGTGTGFYRHLGTGLASLPPIPNEACAEQMKKLGFDPLKRDDYLNFRKYIMYSANEPFSSGMAHKTGLDHSTKDWELLFSAPAVWNRLVLFPSNVFHSPIFDAELNGDSRLTVNVFVTPR